MKGPAGDTHWHSTKLSSQTRNTRVAQEGYQVLMSMGQSNTGVTPLLMHWGQFCAKPLVCEQ